MSTVYTVMAVIQSGTIDKGVPVDVQWYKGTDLAVAITAMAQAATCYDDGSDIPESVRVSTLSVRLDIAKEAPPLVDAIKDGSVFVADEIDSA